METEPKPKDKTVKKPVLRHDSSTMYSGDAKEELLKVIHQSGSETIEHYLNVQCRWKDTDLLPYDAFRKKTLTLFPNIPETDLRALFDNLDKKSTGKIKVADLIADLKIVIKKSDSETMSLLTAADIQPKYTTMTPRSGGSFLVTELKDQCNNQNCTPKEVFNPARKSGAIYALKDDLAKAMRTTLPKLSRDIITKLLANFKDDKVVFADFLVLVDSKEDKRKTPENSEKAQQKWVKHYTSILNKNKLKPMEILKEADSNKNGILELQELEKTLKQYLKSDQIDFKDLQHILDAFDTNNDGKVTTAEYKEAIEKYGEVAGPSDDSSAIINRAKDACKKNGSNLKACLSQVDINEEGEISIQSAQRAITKDTAFDKKDALRLINCFKQPDQMFITPGEVFKFYDNYVPDESNIDLELKYILFRKNQEGAESILQYLDMDMSLPPTEDILLKEFQEVLEDVCFIKKSSAKHVYNALREIRPNIPNPNISDLYCLLITMKNCLAQEKPFKIEPRQLEYTKEEVKAVAAKVWKYLDQKYKSDPKKALQSLSKDAQFDLSDKGTNDNKHLAEFMEIFCDKNQMISPKEAMILFDEISGGPTTKEAAKGRTVNGKSVANFLLTATKVKEEPADIKKPEDKKTEKPIEKTVDKKVEKPSKESPKEFIARIEKESGIYLPCYFANLPK